MTEVQIPQITGFMDRYTRNWKYIADIGLWWHSKRGFKIPAKTKFWKTTSKIEGFCFVISVIGLSGHSIGEDDYGDDYDITTASRRTLGSSQPPIQWLPGAVSPGVNRPGVTLTTHLGVSVQTCRLTLFRVIRNMCSVGKPRGKAIPVTGRGGR
jgi:hypothetical protein